MLVGRRRRAAGPAQVQPGGNRRVNAVLHHMAITQLRWEPRARQLYDNARQRGHTTSEAMRILKRKLSDVVHRRMIRDVTARSSTPLLTQELRMVADPESPRTRRGWTRDG